MAGRRRTQSGKLSDLARHVVVPSGLTVTEWPSVQDRAEALGVTFDPWQDGAGRIILSKRDDGMYATSVGGVVMSIPRQVGKTFLLAAIFFVLCMMRPDYTVLWTAHRERTANETFAAMQGFAGRSSITPFVADVRLGSGEREIRFVNGSRIMFGARERGFGRGFTDVDAEVFDEAQILTENAVDDMVPAMNQAPNPLLLFIGTPPKPKDPSEVFKSKRLQALAGDVDDMAYIEFSADEGCDPDDREQWARANPSFPHRTPVPSIRRMRANLTEDSFLREALGVWDTTWSKQVIDASTWSLRADAASMAIERLTLAVDVAPDQSTASVSLAGLRADERWHVELDEHRAGADWVPAWVEDRAARNRLHAVVADEMSGLVETRNRKHYLKGTDIVVTLAKSEGRDMAVACAQFYASVMDDTLVHTNQPQVNVALSVARKRSLAGGWAWNRKSSDSDITPIVSETLALWGAQSTKVNRPGRGTNTSERRAVVL